MRILQLCNKPPWPPNDGGSMAMLNLTRGLLASGHEVKVLCISTPKHPLDPETVPKELRERTEMEGLFVDTSLNVVDAFNDLLTADNYNISRFFSPDMDIRLIRLLSERKFDVVQLESLFMTPYIPTLRRYTDARIVLRSHNLEYVIQERIAKGEKHILKKPYRRFLAKQLHDYELAVLDRVDGVAAISPADAEHFKKHNKRTPVTSIPFGVDPADYPVEAPRAGKVPVFFHLGSMDWLPNEEGVRWLLREVWPKLVKQRTDARLDLAGNRMPRDLRGSKDNGVKCRGRVKDALEYMTKRDVMVVPLFSAGGMRVKIIEGMALGKAIISTPIGAEGIEHTEGKNILIARNAGEFVAHMQALLDDPGKAASIGRNARQLVEKKYSDQRIVRDITTFYERLLAK